MIIVFWLMVIVLLLGAAALLLVPAMSQYKQITPASRDTLNSALYQDRLAELQQDEDQGKLAERAELVAELQHNLLDDIPGQRLPQASAINRWVLLPGILVLILVAVGLYLYTGGLAEVKVWQQVESEMPELRQRVANEAQTPLNREEITRLGLGLRTSLQSDSNNVNDWVMLGRVGMALNNGTTAIQAFAQAYRLAPTNTEVGIGYAEVLIRSNDPDDNRQGIEMLRSRVAEEPSNLRALSLLAFTAFEQGEYPVAISTWQSILALLPAGDPRIALINRSIAQARVQASEEHVKLVVNVSLSPTVAKELPPQGTLIVSVTDGTSPIPVAVKQLPLSHFPLSLSLDDSNAMMPERLLSAQQQVKVRVRLSQDGLATPQPGDWFGESSLHKFSGQKQVSVQLDKQVP